MKEAFLMRHGRTKENNDRLLVGHSDPPITEEAREKIIALRSRVASPDFVLCSDLRRASETARLLFPGKEIQLLSELRERGFGSLEMKPAYMLGKNLLNWYRLDGDEGVFKGTGAEPLSSVMLRVTHVADLIREVDGQRVMVMAHGAILSYLTNILLNEGLIHHPLNNLNYNRILFNEGNTIAKVDINKSWMD